jgi:hypothetical protein
MAKQKPVKTIQDYIQVLRGVASIQIKALPEASWEVHISPQDPGVESATATSTVSLHNTVRLAVKVFLDNNFTTYHALCGLEFVGDIDVDAFNNILDQASALGEIGIRRGEDAPFVITLVPVHLFEQDLDDIMICDLTLEAAVYGLRRAIRNILKEEGPMSSFYWAFRELWKW